MILVTGCAGYIGSHICYMLKKKKINFIGIDNLKYSNKKNIISKKNFCEHNISSKKTDKLLKKKNIKCVIHCAAYSYVVDGENNKSKYLKNNVTDTKKFIDICKKNSIQNFIFLSSSNVYKDGKSLFKENDLTKPKNIYGQNKLEIEKYLKKVKFKNIIILRLFNVVGLFMKFNVFRFKKKNHQRLFFKIADRKNFPQLKFYKTNKTKFFPKRDFINIKDLTDLILKVIIKMKTSKINQTFNVGSGKAISINSIAKIFKIYNKNIMFLKPTTIAKKELITTKANIKLVKNYFNWKPRKEIKYSITSTLKYSKF